MKRAWMVSTLGALAVAQVASAQVTQQLPPRVTIDTQSVLMVRNQRKVPVTVYLDYGPFDRRLGVVKSLGIDTLRLPEYATRGRFQVRLFVHPDGEVADLATQSLTLTTPARLLLVIPEWGKMPPAPEDTMTEVLPPEVLDDATLTVDNPQAKAVTIFASHPPFDVRLGRIDAGGRATLRFPKSVVGPGRSVSIIIHPDGGHDLASQVMVVKPGEHLGLRVPKY